MNTSKSYNIEIRHTCIVVDNYIKGDNPRMENYLQTYDKARHCMNDVALYFDAKHNRLYMPSGVQYWFIQKNFYHQNIYNKISPDNYMKVPQICLKTKPRDDTQREALHFCIGLDKYENNRRANQIFLNLNTGKGKTYVMIALSAYFSVKTAIIMYAQSWIQQWKERILEYTNTKPDEIYIILGSVSIHRLVNKMVDISKIKYFLIGISTLREYGETNGWDSVHELFKMLYIGIKIYDEAHMRPENIFMIDFFTDVWKTFYVTATPMLSDPFRNIVYQRAYSTVPKIDLYNEETDAHTDYQAILYNSHPTPVDLQQCQTNYGFNIIWYANYLPTKPNYYNILWIVLEDFVFSQMSKDGKVLIYIGTNQSIMRTYYWLKYTYPFYDIGIFTTLVKKEEKQEQLEKKIILSTAKSAGVAVDIKGLEFVVDICEPAKSQVVIRQKLGRTRDWNTLFIDVVDYGFPHLRYYYQQKQKIFEKYARKILPPIRLNDMEIRNRLMYLREKETLLLQQLQERKNLKPVMLERKQVMVFNESKYNEVQY